MENICSALEEKDLAALTVNSSSAVEVGCTTVYHQHRSEILYFLMIRGVKINRT